ncbi:MAG: hypothetical protein J7K01_03415 [Thermovirga sp.]|nr:hypothetical protein [Thermovirga sp.]
MKKEKGRKQTQKPKAAYQSLTNARNFATWPLEERFESLPNDMLWRGPFEGFR